MFESCTHSEYACGWMVVWYMAIFCWLIASGVLWHRAYYASPGRDDAEKLVLALAVSILPAGLFIAAMVTQ